MPTLRSRGSLAFPRSALVLAAALLAGAAHGQSLLALYESARSYDATTLATRAVVESQRYRAEQARAAKRPSAVLVGSIARSEAHVPVAGGVGTNNEQAALTGRQALFNRVSDTAIAQAALLIDVSLFDLELAEQDLMVRIAQAYFDVLAAQDNLATAQASKRAISEQLASAKRNFEVGTATITDTREAQARFDLATSAEIAAENDLRTRRIALEVVVGRSGIEPRRLAAPVRLPDLAPANAEEWVNAAESAHPQINKVRLGQENARLETEKTRAVKLPTFDLTGSLSQSHASGSGVAVSGNTRGVSIGVQMNWLLFDGYATENGIRASLALEEKARHDLEAVRRQIAQATRVAYFGTQSLKAQVAALEAAESSSQLALEATELGYRVGVRVNLDVLNAQSQLFQTRRDLSKARYDVIMSNLRLRQASGQLQPQDLAAVDALLAP